MFITKFQLKQSHLVLGIVLSIIMLGIEVYKRYFKEKEYDFTRHEEGSEDNES